MKDDVLATIEDLLARHIGLDIGSVGRRAVRAAVTARVRAVGCASIDEYLSLVLARPDELGALVEEVVVPETWFFRDRVPFSHLAIHAREHRRAGGDRFRVLSAPCSTGEEPYSIAIALLDAGLAPADFAIDAIDVSERVLALARRGVYGSGSFRGDEGLTRERYFRVTADGWEVGAAPRESVQFTRGNLLDPAMLEAGRRYHAIFCRNVLIYLTPAARRAVLARLEPQLEPGGLFVVGHAEGLQVMDRRFKAIDVAGAFTFVRADGATRAGAAPEKDTSAARRLKSAKATAKPTEARPPRAPVPAPVPAPAVEPARDRLAEAAALANRGDLAAAAELCAQHLNVIGGDAAAFALLGTIRQAGGQLDDAEGCFSRALYCDPGHYESLVQLALLRERRGDGAGAANLRRRAAKARRGATSGGDR